MSWGRHSATHTAAMELAEEVQVVCWVPLHHWGEEEATGEVLVVNERSVVKKKNWDNFFGNIWKDKNLSAWGEMLQEGRKKSCCAAFPARDLQCGLGNGESDPYRLCSPECKRIRWELGLFVFLKLWRVEFADFCSPCFSSQERAELCAASRKECLLIKWPSLN